MELLNKRQGAIMLRELSPLGWDKEKSALFSDVLLLSHFASFHACILELSIQPDAHKYVNIMTACVGSFHRFLPWDLCLTILCFFLFLPHRPIFICIVLRQCPMFLCIGNLPHPYIALIAD